MVKKLLALTFVLVVLCTNYVAAQNTKQYTLGWGESTPVSEISHYTVYQGTESGNYTKQFDVEGLETDVQVPDGIIYYFAVTATSLSGIESDYSNEVNTTQPSIPSLKIKAVLTIEVSGG